MTASGREPSEALAALERLFRRKVVDLEEAQAAARLITGDPAAVFPPPPPLRAAASPPAAEPTAAPAVTVSKPGDEKSPPLDAEPTDSSPA